jgi:hypothetical protein
MPALLSIMLLSLCRGDAEDLCPSGHGQTERLKLQNCLRQTPRIDDRCTDALEIPRIPGNYG